MATQRQPEGEVPPEFRGMTIGQVLRKCKSIAEQKGDQRALKNHEINCAVRGIQTGEEEKSSIIIPHGIGLKTGMKTFREKWETDKPKGREIDL